MVDAGTVPHDAGPAPVDVTTPAPTDAGAGGDAAVTPSDAGDDDTGVLDDPDAAVDDGRFDRPEFRELRAIVLERFANVFDLPQTG